ncbi:MAG: SUMF1/EgtB/PvdO family nonheme iron enzyme [Deltaproteobacteria bacterium]|nr:SUMF1/EgtB/PvdO family nonheme iron enzyme [Deltaproteobacteria bacterium]
MAQIPGGNLSSVGGDARSAVVQPFCMDKTEVTVAAYDACVKAGKCTEAGTEQSGLSAMTGESCNRGVAGKENHPINCVDWSQAKAYCEAVGARLPTEEEWEWAARGGERASKYPWGSAAPGPQVCWGNKKTTCAVGSFPAGDDPWGVHDLAGNVAEWTSNVFKEGEKTVVGSGGRVVRGGSYSAGSMDVAPARWLEASSSRGEDPKDKLWTVGFRCVTAPAGGATADAPVTAPPPPISAEETARWKLYRDKNTVPLYLEFLAKYPTSPYACEARFQLNDNPSGDLVKLASETPTGSVDCNAGSGMMTQSFVIKHKQIIGKKWVGKCPAKVQLAFDVKNPSEATLLVDARYGGGPSYAIVGPKTTARVNATSACKPTGEPQIAVAGGTATLTFTKCQWSGSMQFRAVGDEAKAGKPLLAAAPRDSAAALAFLEANPTSELSYALADLIILERRAALDALLANTKTTIKQGTRSSEVDPLPYTARVDNKNKTAVTVRVTLEKGATEEWDIPAGGSKDTSQTTPAGAKPAFRVVSVRVASTSKLADGWYRGKAPFSVKIGRISGEFAVLRSGDKFLGWFFVSARPWEAWGMGRQWPVAVAVFRGKDKGDSVDFEPVDATMRTCGHEDSGKFGAVGDKITAAAFTANIAPTDKGPFGLDFNGDKWTPRG